MLQVSTWVRVLVSIILFFGVMIALPNALPGSVRAKMPSWLPHNTVSLGLDLQGGSYILLEVDLEDVMKDRVESTLGDIRRALRKAHIGYRNLSAAGDSVSVEIIEADQFDAALAVLKDVNPTVSGAVFSVGGREYDMTQPGHGVVAMRMTDVYKKQTETEIVSQSIEVVRRRIDELGTKEPGIEQQGKDRIVVQVPGLQDPTRLLSILQTTAKMTFQLVDASADVVEAMKGNVPIGDELLPMDSGGKKTPLPPVVVEKRVMVDGDRLKKAGQAVNQQTGHRDHAD